MRLLTLLLFVTFSSIFHSDAIARRISLDKMTFNLEKLNAKNLGIVFWDQRQMVVDKSQPGSFLGYTRSMTQIAFGSITKSQKSLVEILGSKVQQAYLEKGSEVGIINMTPYESESDLIRKLKESSFDRILVIRLDEFNFDGYMKFEYAVNIQTIIYDSQGNKLYDNLLSRKVPVGRTADYRKNVPKSIEDIFEGHLNNTALHVELLKEHEPTKTPISSIEIDVITTREGDEIEAKVLEISETSIKYKLVNHMEGPIRSIAIEKVFMIKYGDGTKEVFKK